MSADKRPNKKLILSIIFALCCVVITVLSVNIFIPSFYYNRAISLIEKGEYEEAYCCLRDCRNYKNSKQLLQNFSFEYDKILTYKYDENGQPIKSKEDIFDKDGNLLSSCYYNEDGEVRLKYEYKYNKQGHRILQITYDENGDVSNEFETWYQYDDKGNVVVCAEYENGTLKIKEEYQYDEKGRLMQFVLYEGEDVLISKTEYSKDGLTSNSVSYSANGEETKTNELFYEDGRIKQHTEFYTDGSKQISKYDRFGNMISHEYFDKDGTVKSNSINKYEYVGTESRIIEEVSYYNGKENYRSEYKYDRHGNIILSITYEKGKLYAKRCYTYDKNGNQLSSTEYDYFSGKECYRFKHVNKYDRYGNRISRRTIFGTIDDFIWSYDSKGICLTSKTMYVYTLEDESKRVTEYVNPRLVYNPLYK